MKKYRQLSFIVIGLILSTVCYSQKEWENSTGEIQDVEVEIIKDREITLLKANRNFEKINPTFAIVNLPKFEYKFQEFDFEIPDLTFKLRPLRIKNEQLQKLYGGYLKAGFGNFGTPYLEGYINNKRDQQYTYGAHIKHLSSKNGPVDRDNSGVSENQIDVFGKLFTKKIVMGASLGFEQDKVHFYGYPDGTVATPDAIKQQFNKFKVNGFVKSNSSVNDPSYQLGVGYQHLRDDFNAKEGVFTTDFDLKYPVNKESSFTIESDVRVIRRTDNAVSDSRFLVSVQPTYQFVYRDFIIKAGLNVAYENDTLESMGKLHLYPIIKAAYDVSDRVELCAGIDGEIVANTYHSAIEQVPFLQADVAISHTNRSYQFTGGIRAKTGKNSYIYAGFSMGGYKHYQYLVNDITDISKFTLTYDPKTSTVGNIFGEWGLSKFQQFQLSLRGDYFTYNMGLVQDVPHQPEYKIAVLTKCNIYNKIILEVSMFVIGGIKAIDPNTLNTIDLDNALDLSVQGTYLFSDQFSIFAKFNNILSQEYQLLNKYPVKGFQAMGGISYTF